MKTHTYFGIKITPATGGQGGFPGFYPRWTAHLGRPLYSDTLEGMKSLIRARVKPTR